VGAGLSTAGMRERLDELGEAVVRLVEEQARKTSALARVGSWRSWRSWCGSSGLCHRTSSGTGWASSSGSRAWT